MKRMGQLGRVFLWVAIVVCSVRDGGAERFDTTVRFEQASIGVNGEMSAANTLRITAGWGFEAGGTIAGRITVRAPADPSEMFYDGEPVLFVRLIDPGTWAAVEPSTDVTLDTPNAPPTAEALQEFAKRQRRANSEPT